MFKGKHIRQAEPDDINGIARIYSAIHDEIEQGRYQMKWARDLYPTREWAEQHIADGDMYVMEERFGGVAAAAVINHTPLPEYADGTWRQFSDYSRILVLHTLVVHPRHQRKGYGTAFMKFYEQMGVSHGCFRLRLDTQAIDTPARELYRRMGYKEMDRVPCQFKGIEDIDLVLIEKILK